MRTASAGFVAVVVALLALIVLVIVAIVFMFKRVKERRFRSSVAVPQ